MGHEGIDTGRLEPGPNAVFTVPNRPNKWLTLRAGEPVITYVARNLEPYRGFHEFMRALQIVQREHQTCHTIIVGGDGVSYGRKPPEATNWREHMLREVSIDPARTHFVGRLPYEQYLRVLQVSAAHVCLVYLFVLSWSLQEAMACGCLVIASDTAPVREVIKDWENGVMVDFRSHEGLASRVGDAIVRQAGLRPLREAARDAASQMTKHAGLDALGELVKEARMDAQQRGATPKTLRPETGAARMNREIKMNEPGRHKAGHPTREDAAC